MSLFFLFVFSLVMKGAVSGIAQPMVYLIAGIVIMTVFQQALNNSTEILNDLSSGFMKEIIVSPIPRWQISLGQILSATAIACIQGCIILVAGFFLGLRISVPGFFGVLGVMLVAGLTFASMGLFLATVSRNSSTFQIAVSVVAMPLTFLSGAYIPVTVIPKFLSWVVYLNPLTHITAMFRYVTLGLHAAPVAELVREGIAFDVNGFVITPIMGFIFIVLFGSAFFLLCVRKFNSADFSSVKTAMRHGRR
jgi:ABC-2 type transport system permease protein